MSKLLIILLSLLTISTSAQKLGTVTGIVTDKEINDESLPFANVFIKGTTIGAITDFEGGYSIDLEAGSYVIVFSFVGYKTVEIPIKIISGQSIILSQSLEASKGISIDKVLVKATTARGKESNLLIEKRKSVSIKNVIGSQELSTKGISNVASAVTKISGVSEQEDSGSIFVRGLGDRYNITSLNGLPLPSNNPSNKNINLNIFPTRVVEIIDVNKIYETDNYGDFGGANINIVSKNFRGKPYFQINLALLGINSNAIAVNDFYLQNGPDISGFKTKIIPLNPLSPGDYTTSWDREKKSNIFNQNFGISGGIFFKVGKERKINTFFNASFKSDYNFRKGISRGDVDVQGNPKTDYNVKTFSYDTNTTLMANVNYRINKKHIVSFNTLYLNSTNQNYSEYRGNNEEFDGGNPKDDNEYGIIQRGTFDRTQLFVNQLLGKNNFTERIHIDWAGGIGILSNEIPDRMQNTFVPSRNGEETYTFFSNSAIDNHRYFQKLDETELSSNINISYKFSKNTDNKFNGTIKIGYSGRFKNINFNSNQYDFNIDDNAFNFPEKEIYNVDNLLNINSFNNSLYNIKEIKQEYFGDQFIQAFLSSVRYNFYDVFTLIVGFRVESIFQSIGYKTRLVPSGEYSEFTEFEILPNISAKYSLNEKQNLKLSVSKTYTLPQYKEKVKLLYEEVTQAYVGNPNLYPSTNYNFDLGWEFFPDQGELISLTTFGKIIQNPINEIFVNSASGDISYVNSGNRANILGVEFELKKKLAEFTSHNDFSNIFNLSTNISYIKSNQDLDLHKVSKENELSVNFTYNEGKLTGASDFLINSDLSYFKEISKKSNLTVNLSYRYLSDKIRVIGTMGRGNLIDKGNSSLNLTVRSKIKKIEIGFSVKNILNPTFETIQENQNVIINSYKKGINYNLSLSYKF